MAATPLRCRLECYGGPMNTSADLGTALAALSDRALLGLPVAIAGAPDAVPGLVAWIEHAMDWETMRRAGHYYPLRGPRLSIDDDDVTISLVTLAVLTERFRDSAETDGSVVASFL